MDINKEAFEIIRAELEKYDLESVAEASEVSLTTLNNWISGHCCARYMNLVKVAHVLGYNIVLKLEKI